MNIDIKKRYICKAKSLSLFIFVFSFFFIFYLSPLNANTFTIGKPLNFLTLNTGLVGHWTFDGPKMLINVADSSGNSKHGYLSGQTSTTTVAGKFGQALSFDGSNDYVSTGNFNVGSSNFTISVWLKKPSGAGDFYFLNQQDGGGNHWYLEIYNNKIYWHTAASGWLSGNNTVSSDIWNHIVIVGNDANTLFYLNGILDLTGAKSSDISSANIPLFIGYNSNYGGYFNGSLDDVRIYNRTLSTTEIQQLYNLGSITKFGMTPKGIRSTGVQSGLISHWTFDGPKMITNVTDSSGSGNNGYLINQISTTTIGGKIGQALLFDGVDDYVNIGTGNTYFPLSAFSICAWVKSPGLASGMSSNGIVSITYGLILQLNGAGQFSTSIDNGVSLDTLSDTRNLYDNVFHHVCLAFNGTNKYISVDGISSTPQSQTWLGTTRWPTISAVIGHNVNNTPIYKFNGVIDDVRIYNRALSTTEIQQLYNQGR